MTTAKEIASHLKKSKRQANGSYMCCCPAHKDRTPSLSISDGKDGMVLWYCQAGCSQDAVYEALVRVGALKPYKGNGEYSGDIAFPPDYPCPRIHIYRDKDGAPVFVVNRQPRPDGGKTFKQYGIGRHNMDDITRLPYNLHHWHTDPTIIIVEGEQSVEALHRAGIPATCNPGGAGNWQEELNQWFKDKHVIIIPDNDEPGRKHAIKVAEHLHKTAKSVRIAPICSSLNDKDDMVQWLVKGDTKNLFDCVALYQDYKPGDDEVFERDWITGSDVNWVLTSNWIVRDIIPGDGFMAAYGKPSAGKSFWAMDIGLHIAAGVGYNGKLTKHGPVAYIALESGRRFQNRMMQWYRQHDLTPKDIPFLLSTKPLNLLKSYEDPEADVHGLIRDLRKFEKKLGQPIKLVEIDTLSRAMAGGNENSPEDMTQFVANCDLIWKTLKCALLIVHHTGKDTAKGLRGHSSLIAAVDTEIEVTAMPGTDGEIKVATILKQRDGAEGEEFGFKLPPVEIGLDSDALMITTCNVEHVPPADMPKTSNKNKQPTGVHQVPILKELKNMMGDYGKDVSPGGGRPVMRCVTVEQLKAVSYPAMTSDSGHRSSDFSKALASLAKNDFVGFYNDYVWEL